jgi:hypothetical protein
MPLKDTFLEDAFRGYFWRVLLWKMLLEDGKLIGFNAAINS